ncbi:uncharacterized protein TEOVI_000205900 [Trypanosoma equiperdum]|uniref:Uncharacterized protein n=1 Tax=Trypanosoma equiperdum TaxID=5694 RepID=A0A1G4IEH1_TRYEQ|nr:hypothetical protein, conserved [Trypanosoma equiperdum]
MSNLPPLTPEEKAARERRLQAEHERYVKSIETMRSLPRLRSTVAGAGGKTNEHVRLAEEREAERRQRLQAEAERLMEKTKRESEHRAKVEALNSKQQKKRAKASKRKARRTRYKLEGGKTENADVLGSDEESEMGGSEHSVDEGENKT